MTQRTVILSWNGTLLDDARLMFDCCAQALSRVPRARPLTWDGFLNEFDLPFRGFCRNHGLTENRCSKYFKTVHRAFWALYSEVEEKADLREGVVELLELCREADVRALILSDYNKQAIARQVDKRGLGPLISGIVGPSLDESGPYSKGRALFGLARNGHIKPEKTVLIGDMPGDIVLANGLRMQNVAVTGGLSSDKRLEASRYDSIVSSMRDVPSVLRQGGFAL